MSDLSYHVAATLDGFIARADGSFDGFAWDDDVVADFFADQKEFGTVLMGCKTYEVGLREGKTSPYPAMRQIVFSRTMEQRPDDAVELVRDDVVAFVRALKAEADAPIWLCGGADLASTLMAAGLVDRVVVKLNPVLFGTGIPLLRDVAGARSLKLRKTKVYDCGIVLLRYDVAGAGDGE